MSLCLISPLISPLSEFKQESHDDAKVSRYSLLQSSSDTPSRELCMHQRNTVLTTLCYRNRHEEGSPRRQQMLIVSCPPRAKVDSSPPALQQSKGYRNMTQYRRSGIVLGIEYETTNHISDRLGCHRIASMRWFRNAFCCL